MSTANPGKRAVNLLFILTGLAVVGPGIFVLTGANPGGKPDIVWGERGVRDGDFVRPRAIAIDAQDRLFVVDFTARIQVFDRDGQHLGPTWTTPDYRAGRPSGLSIANDGNLIVSDSHYNCFRIYTPEGVEIRTIATKAGQEPGQLSYVSDVVQDKDDSFFVAEFGENQRISHFDSDGQFLHCWGEQGVEPGQFNRIRSMTFGPDDNLYVADACNHRIQVFTRTGQFLRAWGEPGKEPGQMTYPYDLAFGPRGELYVIEYGNNRVQKFTLDGKSLGTWGSPGAEVGKLHSPWALAVDSKGRVHVVDSNNHRVQRIAF